MSNSETKKKRSGGKQYLITLQARNSRTALIACVITLFFALYGIAGGLVLYAYNGDVAKELFRYFTVDSNLLTALGAGMLIPFAVEGIRKNRSSRRSSLMKAPEMKCMTCLRTADGMIP